MKIMNDPRIAQLVVILVVLGTITVIAFSLFAWQIIEKTEKIRRQHKMAEYLYNLWKDAYWAGWNDGNRFKPAMFYDQYTDSAIADILKCGYLEGYEDKYFCRSHKVNCYDVPPREKYPPAWEYIQRVAAELEEKKAGI